MKGIVYKDGHFQVRAKRKRDGRIVFALERPKSGACLQEFKSEMKAAFVARYCTLNFNGAYDAHSRNEAGLAYDTLYRYTVEPEKHGYSVNDRDVMLVLTPKVTNKELIELLIDNLKFFYTGLTDEEIIIAGLEELLAQNLRQ